MAIFQQIVGVNTVIYYAPTILQQTGLKANAAITETVTIRITNIVFTILAILLLDRVGRRPLVLTGTVALGVALLGQAAYFAFPSIQNGAPWLALAALLLFIAGYAVGLGPVFWLMISEIFPQKLRSKATSATFVANWLSNFAVSASFLTLTNAITRQGAFVLYAALAASAVAFFAWRVPETRGKTLEAIQNDVGGAASASAPSEAGARA